MKLRLIVFFAVTAAASALAQDQTPAPAAAGTAQLQLRAKRLAALRGKIANALGLSAAQKQQMKAIRQQARLTAQPVAGQLKQNRQALAAAVKAGDAAQIQALSKTQGELMGQALTIRGQAQAQLYAGLTNDQRQRFDTLQARIQARIARQQAILAPAN